MFGRLLLRLFLPALLAFLLWRSWRRLVGSFKEGYAQKPPAGKPEKGQVMARDPVCGTFVVPNSALMARAKSGTVYFCSDKCRQAYLSRA